MESIVNNTGLDTLPEVVMEHLVKFCDGKTLIALGGVCKKWMNFILEERTFMQMKWGKVCVEEIPPDFILDILLTLYPKYWLDDQNIFWSDVYIFWNGWRLSSNLQFEVSKLGSFENVISSILFSGDWILIGTREAGGLQALNYQNLETRLLYNRCSNVKSMYLRSTPDSVNTSEYFLNGVEHEEIILQLSRETISFNLISGKVEEFKHIQNLKQLRHFGGQEVKIVSRIYSSEVFSKDIISENVCQGSFENLVCNILQVWNGFILLMFHSGQLQTFDFKLRPLNSLPVNTIKLDKDDIFTNGRPYYVWHLDVILILGPLLYADSWFEIYVKGKVRKYYPFQEISAMVTSALYHAGIIFFGTDLGDIFIYKVESDSELLELNLSQPLYKLAVTDSQILSLAISNTPSGKPLLAVATANDLFLINAK